MHRLILLRHAKTEPWSEGIDDHARALTDRGKSDAALIAKELKRRGWDIEVALVSTARRARETWRVVSDIHSDSEARLEDDLYLAGPELIGDVIARHPGDRTMVVIGHNPGLHEAACDYGRQPRDGKASLIQRLFETFPTGCAALFEASDTGVSDPADLVLVDVIQPKDLRAD